MNIHAAVVAFGRWRLSEMLLAMKSIRAITYFLVLVQLNSKFTSAVWTKYHETHLNEGNGRQNKGQQAV